MESVPGHYDLRPNDDLLFHEKRLADDSPRIFKRDGSSKFELMYTSKPVSGMTRYPQKQFYEILIDYTEPSKIEHRDIECDEVTFPDIVVCVLYHHGFFFA